MRQRNLHIDPEPELMLPYSQYDRAAIYRPGNLMLRTGVDPALLADAVRREIQAVDSSVPVSVLTMEQVAAQSLNDRQRRTVLITGFASLAMLLSVLGVYALVSFAVTDRTRELGIRLVLGATPASLVRRSVKEGLTLALIGCAAGLLTALGLTWTLESFLYGVTPTEPGSFIAVTLLTILAAIIASYVPARRVLKMSPVAALRQE